MKPGGQLVLSFVEKESMKSMPFTAFGFNLFNESDVAALVRKAGSEPVKTLEKSDETISANGDEITRTYIILSSIRRRVI
jgi:hypothetical protein